MLMKISLFDKRYFRYTLKKIFPYALVMFLVLILASFLTFAFDISISVVSPFIEPMLLGSTSYAGMYIIPVLLAIGMFGFLHKRNSADFLFGSPVKRSAVFMTNIISALIIFAVILALNFLFIGMLLSLKDNVITVFSEYLLAFLYNLAGYMLVFVCSSIAASLTGTPLSQVLMTYVIMLLPTFLACFIQLPFTIQNAGGFISVNYSLQISRLLLIPDIVSAPISMVFLFLSEEGFKEFYGTFEYFMSIRSILFTSAVTVIYMLLGIYLFNRYKAENASNAFTSRGVAVFAYSGSFGPVMLMAFLAFADSGYADMVESPLFYIFLVLMWVAFLVVSLLFNKGFSGFGKQMRLFFILLAATCVFSGVAYQIGEHSIKTFDFRTEDISSITVYMPPVNISSVGSECIKENYRKIKITDPDILIDLKGGSPGKRYAYEVVYAKGSRITLYSALPAEFIESVCRYLDENPDLKKTLIAFPGAKHVIATALNLKTVDGYRNFSSLYQNSDETLNIIMDQEEKYLSTPVKALYELSDSAPSYRVLGEMSYADTVYISSEQINYGINSGDTFDLSIAALRYHNGKTYSSYYRIGCDSDFFLQFAEEYHKKSELIVSWIINRAMEFNASVVGTFFGGHEQYLNLAEMINSIQSVGFMKNEFITAVEQAIREPIIPENSVAVSIQSPYGNSLVFMNIDRDLSPLIDKYLDRAISSLRESQELDIAFGGLFGKQYSICTGFFSQEEFHITPSGLAGLIEKNKDQINDLITTRVSQETMKDEYYFLEAASSFEYGYFNNQEYLITVPVTEEMLADICDIFDYLGSRKEKTDPSNISSVYFTDYDITSEDRASADYISHMLRYYYFRKASEEISRYIGYYGYRNDSEYIKTTDISVTYSDGSSEFAQIPDDDRLTRLIDGNQEGDQNVYN